MDLQNITLFKMANESMRWAGQRQKVVSQNIANVNTPDYIPSDLKALDFSRELNQKKVVMEVTNAKHRTERSVNTTMDVREGAHIPSRHSALAFREYENRRSYETSLDGNGVVLEEESLKLSENRTMNDRAATIYQKYNNMLNTAIGSNN